jgi:hypothetical protein
VARPGHHVLTVCHEPPLVGPGAGRIEKGYTIVGDLFAIHRKRQK